MAEWVPVSNGMPPSFCTCAVRSNRWIGFAKYNGSYSEWLIYNGDKYISIPDMNDRIEYWHILPDFDAIESYHD